MRTKLKRLKHHKSPEPIRTHIIKKSWAERHAPLATIIAAYSTLAAVIVAGLGYYFTVIPLYQKAAVDELIAKREFELKVVQATIVEAKREVYEQRRENFSIALENPVIACTDILREPSSSSLDPTVISAELERKIRLDVEVEPCLASILAQYNASEVLTRTDYLYIGKIFSEVGIELDRQRSETKNRIAVIPMLAATDPSLLAPLGEHAKHWDEVAEAWQEKISELNSKLGIGFSPFKDRTQERLQYRIGITQLQIADEYRLNALKTIRETVRGIEWPRDVGED